VQRAVVEWRAPPTPKRTAGTTIGPHQLLGPTIHRASSLLWVFFISAILATESVETWLISVSVCCLLLGLKALVCCLLLRLFWRRGTVRQWQNGLVAEQVKGRTVRGRLLLLT
jgi:hypothetical protein